MLIAFALALASAADGSQSVIGHGFCAGKMWMDLLPGEYAEFRSFADTWVYRVHNRRGKTWAAGGYSNGPPIDERLGVGPIVFRRPGYVVRRAPFFDDAGKIGKSYLISAAGSLPTGEEISYYDANTVILSGSVFSWTARDGALFDRIHVGSDADRKCMLFWKRMS